MSAAMSERILQSKEAREYLCCFGFALNDPVARGAPLAPSGEGHRLHRLCRVYGFGLHSIYLGVTFDDPIAGSAPLAPSCKKLRLGGFHGGPSRDLVAPVPALNEPVTGGATLAPGCERLWSDGILDVSRVCGYGVLGVAFDDPVAGRTSLTPSSERGRLCGGYFKFGFHFIFFGIALDEPVTSRAPLAPCGKRGGRYVIFDSRCRFVDYSLGIYRGILGVPFDNPVAGGAALAPGGEGSG